MFKIGEEYKRRTDIHGPYGGQAQGGISTPKNFPVVFIFTSEAGEQHGYKDEYHDGVFYYTGEGQKGDMKMEAGNKAIRDHVLNGKTIHVFAYTRKAYVRYMGPAECLGYDEKIYFDTHGNNRKVFVFHLAIDPIEVTDRVSEPLPNYAPKIVENLKNKSIEDLRKAALCSSSKEMNTKEKRAILYYRSEALKLYVIARSKGICEGCVCDAPFQTKKGPFLECHHVLRLADGGPDHPKNVVALCPNCHRRAHYAHDAVSFNKKLIDVALRAEQHLL